MDIKQREMLAETVCTPFYLKEKENKNVKKDNYIYGL
jgi:hypothetical protein